MAFAVARAVLLSEGKMRAVSGATRILPVRSKTKVLLGDKL
jgi:hypothetical protein